MAQAPLGTQSEAPNPWNRPYRPPVCAVKLLPGRGLGGEAGWRVSVVADGANERFPLTKPPP